MLGFVQSVSLRVGHLAGVRCGRASGVLLKVRVIQVAAVLVGSALRVVGRGSRGADADTPNSARVTFIVLPWNSGPVPFNSATKTRIIIKFYSIVGFHMSNP